MSMLSIKEQLPSHFIIHDDSNHTLSRAKYDPELGFLSIADAHSVALIGFIATAPHTRLLQPVSALENAADPSFRAYRYGLGTYLMNMPSLPSAETDEVIGIWKTGAMQRCSILTDMTSPISPGVVGRLARHWRNAVGQLTAYCISDEAAVWQADRENRGYQAALYDIPKSSDYPSGLPPRLAVCRTDQPLTRLGVAWH